MFAADLLNPVVLVLLALAIYRLARLAIEDVIFDGPRNRIWKKFPPDSTKIGYFFTCYWCMSLWIAVVVVVLYLLIPFIVIPVAAILALSAVVGILDHLISR